MLNDRAPFIETIKQLEMPLQDLATLADVGSAARVTDYKAGRKLSREVELRIQRAVKQVEMVWQGYGDIRIPLVPVEGFQRALANLEFQEKLQRSDENLTIIQLLRAELHRREQLAMAAEPITTSV